MNWRDRVRDALPVVTGDFRRDADIQDELADHCAAREAELRQQGVDGETAEARVLAELAETARRRPALDRGSRAPAGRRIVAARVGVRWIAHVGQDARYALRVLRRTPAASMAAVLTLALTIGATTGIFSVVQAVLLRPLPYPDAGRLVRVWEARPRGDSRNVVSSGNYVAWTERTSCFSALGAFQYGLDTALTGVGEPEKLTAALMTPSVLDVLRVGPAIGHVPPPGTMAVGQPREVLLSDGLWRRRFGADPGVVGRVLTLDGETATVAGVMPRGFAFPAPDTDVWFALRFDAAARDEWRSHNFRVIARLGPEFTCARAQAEMTTLVGTLAREHPADLTGWGVNVVPAHADAVRDVRPLLLVLMGVVGVVLVIACANLATLQLARASRRGVEMAVRTAVGAGRGRLVRQLLTESVILALAGGVLGALLLAGSLRAMVAVAPGDIPFLDTVRLDPVVLGFAAAITLLCAVLVGLAPALQISRAPARTLLAAARTASSGAAARTRQLLVAGQIGLAVVLLVAAMLLAQSFWKLGQVDHGFDPNHVLAVSLDLPRARYPDNASQVRFYDGLVERLRALPGVTAAAGTTSTPGHGAGMTFSFAIEGRQAPNPTGREDPVPLQGVTPGYFAAMGIPVLEGRTMAFSDRVDTPGVLVINEALAKTHWPAGGAVGTRVRFRVEQPWYTNRRRRRRHARRGVGRAGAADDLPAAGAARVHLDLDDLADPRRPYRRGSDGGASRGARGGVELRSQSPAARRDDDERGVRRKRRAPQVCDGAGRCLCRAGPRPGRGRSIRRALVRNG